MAQTVTECLAAGTDSVTLINGVNGGSWNVEGMTQAEINENNEPTPLVIFIARDHHNTNTEFVNIQENEDIEVKIVGKRFELNDTYISVIGELVSNEIV